MRGQRALIRLKKGETKIHYLFNGTVTRLHTHVTTVSSYLLIKPETKTATSARVELHTCDRATECLKCIPHLIMNVIMTDTVRISLWQEDLFEYSIKSKVLFRNTFVGR